MPANPKKTVEQYLKTQLSVQDDEIIREIYQEFLTVFARNLSSAGKALAEGDYTRLGVIAHTLKGDVAIIGLQDLKSLVMSLQEHCRTGDAENCRLLLKQLTDYFARC